MGNLLQYKHLNIFNALQVRTAARLAEVACVLAANNTRSRARHQLGART